MCMKKSSYFQQYFQNIDEEWEICSRKTDKTWQVYHVFQRGKNREAVFSAEVGKYRHNLLCKICADHGVIVIYSVVMPNHTHDVFAAESLDKISYVMKILNTKVSQYIRKRQPDKYVNYSSMFDGRPTYKPVKNRVYLFYLGMYLYENPSYLKNNFVPYSCFWMFEKGYLLEGYKKELYEDLFGMTPQEIVEIYKTKSKEEVYRFAVEHFSDWSSEKNISVFKSRAF